MEENEIMMNTAIKTIKGMTTSKTIWGNTIGVPTILLALKSLGVVTTNPLIIGGTYILANLFLRIVTKKPLSEK